MELGHSKTTRRGSSVVEFDPSVPVGIFLSVYRMGWIMDFRESGSAAHTINTLDISNKISDAARRIFLNIKTRLYPPTLAAIVNIINPKTSTAEVYIHSYTPPQLA
jgi:hypothetical protein